MFAARRVLARRWMSSRPVMNDGEKLMHEKLVARFNPSELTVQDLSGGCGSFYAVNISSSAFKGLPMVKQHRLVTEALKEEIPGIHGLQIKTSVSA